MQSSSTKQPPYNILISCYLNQLFKRQQCFVVSFLLLNVHTSFLAVICLNIHTVGGRAWTVLSIQYLKQNASSNVLTSGFTILHDNSERNLFNGRSGSM